MLIEEYRVLSKKTEKETHGLCCCPICDRIFAPYMFEEIKVSRYTVKYCRFCKEKIIKDAVIEAISEKTVEVVTDRLEKYRKKIGV